MFCLLSGVDACDQDGSVVTAEANSFQALIQTFEANTMVFSRFHVATMGEPRRVATDLRGSTAGPIDIFSFPCAKKPSERPSG